jgi:ABC-type polysaccharide/polyol phosphate export permease
MKVNQTNLPQIVITGVEDTPQNRAWLEWVMEPVQQLRHILQYRDLVRNLVIRDLKVRYKNSALGILWSLLNPLLMMVVFTVVFTIMAPVRSGTVGNFPVFVLCALLPWNFFATSVIGSTTSIVANSALIKKVYFPREILPVAVILANLVNFVIAMVILFGLVGILFQIPLTIWLLYLPLVVLIQITFTLGIGFLLATANVFYRDTHQIMDVLMLAWFFVTPIFYPIEILPRNYEILGVNLDVWRLANILNPMASLVATYRVILYNGSPPALDFLARTAVTAAVFFLIGWLIFHRYSWRFAEEL